MGILYFHSCTPLHDTEKEEASVRDRSGYIVNAFGNLGYVRARAVACAECGTRY